MKALLSLILLTAAFSGCASSDYSNPRFQQPEAVKPGQDDVKAVLAGSRKQFRHCWEQRVHAEPKVPSGRMLADFRVAPDGRAMALHFTENTIQSPALDQCLSDAIYSLQFTPDPHGQPVRHAFVFMNPNAPEQREAVGEEDYSVLHGDRDHIRQTIQESRAKFRECAVDYFENRKQSAMGKVLVRFFIEPTGVVSDPIVTKSEIHDPISEACILKVFSGIFFKKPGKLPSTVVYPIVFQLKK